MKEMSSIYQECEHNFSETQGTWQDTLSKVASVFRVRSMGLRATVGK